MVWTLDGIGSPLGVNIAPDGRTAFVTLAADETMGVVDLEARKLTRRIKVQQAPDASGTVPLDTVHVLRANRFGSTNKMAITTRISPCLWFDDQAEQAASYYVSVFKRSKITDVSRYTEAGKDQHGRPPGSAMMVEFEIDGQPIKALNGGPHYQLTPAFSFMVFCDTQEEIDYYWEALGKGGDPKSQVCGWLQDRFGLSWQVVPARLSELLRTPAPGAGNRVMTALLRMKKIDLAALERAAAAG